MGLGSKDEERRKQIKSVLPKSDWKSKVKGSAAARESIHAIQEQLAKDPSGQYLLDAYASIKLNQLEHYEKYCWLQEQMNQPVLTLKEYLAQ